MPKPESGSDVGAGRSPGRAAGSTELDVVPMHTTRSTRSEAEVVHCKPDGVFLKSIREVQKCSQIFRIRGSVVGSQQDTVWWLDARLEINCKQVERVELTKGSAKALHRIVHAAYQQHGYTASYFDLEALLDSVSAHNQVAELRQHRVRNEAPGTAQNGCKERRMVLEDLPEDVLLRTASFLGSSDLRELRSVSRSLRETLETSVPFLNLLLYPHQRRSLSWMLEREKPHRSRGNLSGREDLTFVDLTRAPPAAGEMSSSAQSTHGCGCPSAWFSFLRGMVVFGHGRPRSDTPDFRGGLLCDEPGLGKTVCAISLICKTIGVLPRPAGNEVIIQDTLTGMSCYTPEEAEHVKRRSSMPGMTTPERRLMRQSKRTQFYDGRRTQVVNTEYVDNWRVYLSQCTLIIVPDNLIYHWESQFKHFCRKDGEDGSAIEVRTLTAVHLQFPEPTQLANVDVLLTTLKCIHSEFDGLIDGTSRLLRVHWLRVVFDEGHTIGTMSSNSDTVQAFLRLRAERRWILTGTPSARTDTFQAFSYLRPLLHLCGDRSLGADMQLYKDAWTEMLQKPCAMQSLAARELVHGLVFRCMMRNKKSDVVSIPKCIKTSVRLQLTGKSKDTYEHLVRLLRRNLFLADFFDETHFESLLNPKRKTELSLFLTNLRRACCVAGQVNVALNVADLKETIEVLANTHGWHHLYEDETIASQKGSHHDGEQSLSSERVQGRESERARVRLIVNSVVYYDRLAEIVHALMFGCACSVCSTFSEAPLVTPCAHILCVTCASESKLQCACCGTWHRLGEKNEPVDFIELQPSYEQSEYHPDSYASLFVSSTKSEYLVRRLHEIGAAAAAQEASGHGHRRASPKAIVFSEFKEHMYFVQQELGRAGICFASFTTLRHREERMQELYKFRDDSSVNVLLIDKSASVGHDLSFVSFVFLMEPVWNTSLELQIISRAWRLGATRPVRVELLLAEGTIEEQLEMFAHGEHDSSGGFSGLSDVAALSMRGVESSQVQFELRKIGHLARQIGVPRSWRSGGSDSSNFEVNQSPKWARSVQTVAPDRLGPKSATVSQPLRQAISKRAVERDIQQTVVKRPRSTSEGVEGSSAKQERLPGAPV
ncbi:F-box protein [Porphyridium purpureum]|uniref:F-box protein n=1 Tax=Porphyridium purpureum TaxID=35688 RepID=A0A5J4YM79_PORPP|nr:F-box protein [Porphyridium purpureum]|eukprot:POR7777..scf295_9